MQAFCALYCFLEVEATVGLFLHYFDLRPITGWVSFIWNPSDHLIRPFTASYKDFKTGFFKVNPKSAGV